ncbi:hypothetical protein ABWK24_16850 [Priestia megaterium]|uniref:hypothetical protein n=1 Tax=Priestia megaterium TaxID=1404 RepID=UPI0033947478
MYGRDEDIYEESHDWASKCKEDKGKKGNTRESAFRALNLTMPQNVPANTFVKAVFPTEQFDLANTIYNLEAGDRVEVFVQSSIAGTIVTSEDGSHFEAARFPSPTNN